ncbi:MAG: histidine phosphatase family protein [Proteobacteria bacterium]|nr:histidine phosphatase family protein [Pseudomonadota bacterium]MBU1641186.1 histidine phosphatase family protein [Pseudomonadota bacterium]
MAPKIYLTRHGKTQANREDRFAGRSDEPLCEEGVSQLQRLAEKCGGMGFTAIYAGPLPRTTQSAHIIADTCGQAVHTVAGLIDINLPHWDTLTKDEIRQRFGNEYPTWLATPEKFHVPGCEDLAAVQKRAVAEVEKILAEATGVILLVTHLIVARCLLLHYNGQPMSRFREIKVENGEVVRLV